jgi:hypothetical protein
MKAVNPVGTLAFLLAAAVALPGCSGRQMYDAGYGWRMHACHQILDDYERARCLETAKMDYDTYKSNRAPDPAD